MKNKKTKFDNETIFRYFNIRNFEIPKYRSFYISSFQILTPTRFPFLSLFFRQRSGLDNVTAAILSYAVSHLQRGHWKTADNLCRYSRRFHSLSQVYKSLKKITSPAQRFDMQVPNRRSSMQVLTQRQAAGLGWPPGAWHLPHTERCR